MESIAKSTHPMILVAATALTVASLAATAYFTGLLPLKSAPEPAAVVATPQPAPPKSTPAPAPAPVAEKPASPQTAKPVKAEKPPREAKAPAAYRDDGYRRQTNDRPERTYAAGDNRNDALKSPPPPAPAPCRECGTIESVREIATAGEGTGLGAVAGGVLGGVLGKQVGRGGGKTAATVIGALGGAYAGHQVEKNVRTEKQLEITVRFDDGSTRSFTQSNSTRWQTGDRIRLEDGILRPL